MCMSVSQNIYMYTTRVQFLKRPGEALDLLELELQSAVSHLMWGLGTELKSSGRAVCTLNSGAISPAPELRRLWSISTNICHSQRCSELDFFPS